MTIHCHNDNLLSIACGEGGAVMTIPAEATRPDNGFIDALHVSGPAGEHAGKLMLFGQFVGSWDLEWAGHLDRSRPRAARRGPATLGVSRFHDPVLRPLYRRLAFHLGRTRQLPGAAVRWPVRRR